MMAVFREVDTVESKFNIPMAGVYKGSIQFFCQQPVFFCKLYGLCYKHLCWYPDTSLHGWRSNQQNLMAQGKKRR